MMRTLVSLSSLIAATVLLTGFSTGTLITFHKKSLP